MAEPADPIGYAHASSAYWQAGWRGILPIPSRSKIPPPDGFTGHAGVDPSYADILEWANARPNSNLCLRLPDGIVGIDVDAYGAKTGAAAIAEATKRWGSLPPAPWSTSRDVDPVSGIRLFRVPEGTYLKDAIEFNDLGIGDIEIIQRHHRYVICWPSTHPDNRTYWWRSPHGSPVGIPDIDSIPPLPQRWIDALRITGNTALSSEITCDIAATLTQGQPSTSVSLRLSQAIKELNAPGRCRHDTAMRHTLALMRLGKSGQPGVHWALKTLRGVFIAAVTMDESRTRQQAASEFDRFLSNPNAATQLAQPGLLDWMSALVPETPHETPPEPQSDPRPIASSMNPLVEIEQGFWEARESLNMIYTTAMARMVSPWAVLAHCAAKALTQVRPHVVLPPLIGGEGSLNWFGVVAAPSGGGKGAASAASRLLIPGHVEMRNAGSGEGIVAAFGRPQDDGDPTPVHEALMFNVDEIDTLAALNQRTASTTLGVLRSGWSGETLGFSYSAKDKRRHLAPHTYRMTMVVSVQPLRAGWLLNDGAGGMTQRFMWFPGTDSRISRKKPWPTGPLTLPAAAEWNYPREIIIPQKAVDLIEDEHVKRGRDEGDALDGHAVFCRAKFAYALTVLDGRVDMTVEDWELSGIAAAVSLHTREKVTATVREGARVEAIDRGEIRGIEMAAAEAEKQLEEAERLRAAIRWALSKITEAGESGISHRELQQKSSRHNRRLLDYALENIRSNGLVRQVEGTTIWVAL